MAARVDKPRKEEAAGGLGGSYGESLFSVEANDAACAPLSALGASVEPSFHDIGCRFIVGFERTRHFTPPSGAMAAGGFDRSAKG